MDSGLQLEVSNRHCLSRIYGEAQVEAMERELLLCVRAFCASYGHAVDPQRAGLLEITADQFPLPVGEAVDAYIASLRNLVFRWKGGVKFLGWRLFATSVQVVNTRVEAYRGVDSQKNIVQVSPEDLAISGQIWDALVEDRVELAFQPVCHSEDRNVILYYECLSRCSDRSGQAISPAVFVPALERLGLIRLLDRHLFRKIFELLDKESEVSLGLNISALSAVDDDLWGLVFFNLHERPDIARRLVVEITETASCDAIKIWAFARHLQRLGCRVAVDDFGSGYSLETAAAMGRVDIVKIDASLIRQGIAEGSSSLSLGEAVRLASDLASCVIAEGVETEKDLSLARSKGIEWGQGHYFGIPSRSFLSGALNINTFLNEPGNGVR